MKQKQGKALKFDKGKPRYDLVPVYPLRVVVDVLTWAVTDKPKPYTDHNWRKGQLFSKTLASLERHIQQFKGGEDLDWESRKHHLAHAVFECMYLIEHRKTHPELDDRFKKGVNFYGEIKFVQKANSA
jgi:hypothetical protein